MLDDHDKGKCFYFTDVNTFPQDVCKLVYMQTIGDRIRARRKEINATQAEIAARMGGGSKRESLSQWETGAHQPSGEQLMRLARALGVNPDWLVSGRGDPAARPQSVNGVRFGQSVSVFTNCYCH